MEVQGLYAVVNVGDLPRSEDYYTRLLGRGPDDRPMDGLIQWRGFGSAGIQLFADQEKAGKSVMTIVTPEMEATRRGLSEQDIELGEIQRGDYGLIAQLEDPDGNRIILAEPPSKPMK